MKKLVYAAWIAMLLTAAAPLQPAEAGSVIPGPIDYSKLKPLPEPPTGPTIGPREDPIIPPGCGMNCPGPFDSYPGQDLPMELPKPLPQPWID
ncbi:hypothetical protein EN833_15115 [Mesorhizobium sp. M4B.F.Ca.ET.190.01.1.1]|uniref:hypothetical protein n=1 Tax=unclassified Mesorhizobium TaxID=325217 RepID=UPI001091B8BB|nr:MULTISPECIES: hypothetical protein [unclassified Mesorhizobium]TGR08791.1 hypothetical protein EN843_15110 [Mesorhizobium sp. M4B.F.Ca.ET.200.01.1.1]TGS18268.1 hypothetical protein EN833_15115 [Mesorhizobium sp. M4B.F.Ca.ET.190.01.1.1]TGT30081.1 hypothetical protein EN815_15095 [Mesorhizobium sp. M4B.F.Ca.ET.172.01.1.1]